MNFFMDLRADLFLRDCSVPKYEMKKTNRIGSCSRHTGKTLLIQVYINKLPFIPHPKVRLQYNRSKYAPVQVGHHCLIQSYAVL